VETAHHHPSRTTDHRTIRSSPYARHGSAANAAQQLLAGPHPRPSSFVLQLHRYSAQAWTSEALLSGKGKVWNGQFGLCNPNYLNQLKATVVRP